MDNIQKQETMPIIKDITKTIDYWKPFLNDDTLKDNLNNLHITFTDTTPIIDHTTPNINNINININRLLQFIYERRRRRC